VLPMATLKEIVEQRLAQIQLGPIEAATRVKLERTFIRDIVEGRKKSVGINKIAKLAEALSLDASALAKGQLVPSPTEPPATGSLITTEQHDGLVPFAGEAQAGAYFRVDLYTDDRKRFVRIPRDRRYIIAKQHAWLVKGDSMDAAGLYPGMFVLGIDYEDFTKIYQRYLEDGDIVVVECLRFDGREREVTIKRYYRETEHGDKGVLLAPESNNPKHTAIFLPDDAVLVGETVNILAYVTLGFTVLGEPFADLDHGGAFSDIPVE
jgi:SOS-response transcriptional repressor LexA